MTPRPDPAARLARDAARAARRPGAARTLLLDLDGTLAPLASSPGEARVPDGTLDSLRRLVRGGWRVAIVSGRPVAQVRRMVPVRGVRAFGSHGREGSWDGGRRPGLPAPLRRRLEILTRRAGSVARGVPGAYVERKPAGVALHDRNVGRRNLLGWRRQVRELLATADLEGFEVLRGRRVIEIRPWGHHKGVVVESLPQPRRGFDASLIAMGDDRTDEDLFRAMGSRGVTVRVGRKSARTAARRRLPSPRSVGRFLRSLAVSVDATTGRPPPCQIASGQGRPSRSAQTSLRPISKCPLRVR